MLLAFYDMYGEESYCWGELGILEKIDNKIKKRRIGWLIALTSFSI